MASVYEKILELCQQKGVSPGKMCNDLGYSRNTMTALKNGRSTTIKLDKAQRIAAYFGVSVDYLLGNDTKKEPAADSDGLTARDRRDIARDLEKIMRDLEEQDTLMFDGDPASPEARESIRNALAMGLEYAKKLNKEKYTPKKYRKSKDQEE
ncbi:helix-turn-helix transcriptional regulator [Anaerofilum sp. BX8]|uniref:Helix-turn-helix transcriptional regulator n=1 Tax=Anaerofilum hominis TaxID=2763016 RepID=A0A923I8I4_9FIRM|nr:helix-turn-helix transcriptional regulator [Anaerofilum hominis]MBC5580902.1 helix-turn-helix transcriptional regulator [Anaerofilum hominis]